MAENVDGQSIPKAEAERLLAESHGWQDDLLALHSDADAWQALWNQEYEQQLVCRALEIMQTHFAPKSWQAAWELTVNWLTAAEREKKLGLSEAAVCIAKSQFLRRLRQEFGGRLD